jgi:hypothetical protein
MAWYSVKSTGTTLPFTSRVIITNRLFLSGMSYLLLRGAYEHIETVVEVIHCVVRSVLYHVQVVMTQDNLR